MVAPDVLGREMARRKQELGPGTTVHLGRLATPPLYVGVALAPLRPGEGRRAVVAIGNINPADDGLVVYDAAAIEVDEGTNFPHTQAALRPDKELRPTNERFSLREEDRSALAELAQHSDGGESRVQIVDNELATGARLFLDRNLLNPL